MSEPKIIGSSASPKTIRSKVTEPEPGLTEGKAYSFVRWGFWQGPYIVLINDRNQEFAIYDPHKYLYTEDLKN